MRFNILSSVAAVLLVACASPPATRDGASPTDTQRTAASAAGPCTGKQTGDTCTFCDPNDATCVETMDLKVCDPSGTCTSQVSPPPYDACGGKKTGDTCTLCAPNDATCIETMVLKTCNASGDCG